ncbi:MAG: PilZ domain-containing protein [Desulfobacterales bacterium]|nr:PilZ domain-containing protein [Desulfobacterales bacterium]MBF0396871.1 PilZ domain-containing protein [Desulfobacterales bacterium]
MKKKPIPILVATFAYLLLPFFYYIQIAYLANVSVLEADRVLSLYTPETVLLSLSAIIVSYCIYIVKRWSFYVFLVNSIIAIIWNGCVAFYFQGFTIILAIYLLITIAILLNFILIKDMRTPYFNPRIRWWEQEKRYRFDLPATIHFLRNNLRVDGQIFDISASGLFWTGIMKGEVGHNVGVKIHHEKLSVIPLVGEIVWVSDGKGRHPRGGGIKFVKTTKSEQKFLRRTLNKMQTEPSR